MKGGERIAICKIFACNAADYLADRSVKRPEDGGA